MSQFIHIKTGKFPIQPDEQEEIINEGMYGKALSEYLTNKLRQKSVNTDFYCAEDWGWWVDASDIPADVGFGVYCLGDPNEYAVTLNYTKKKKFKLFQLKTIDFTEEIERIETVLQEIFEEDPDIEVVSITPEFPL